MFDYVRKPLDTSLFIYIHVFTTLSLFCQEPRERIPTYIFSKIPQRHFFPLGSILLPVLISSNFIFGIILQVIIPPFKTSWIIFIFLSCTLISLLRFCFILWINYSFRFRNLYMDFKHLFTNDLGMLSLPWEWFWLVFFLFSYCMCLYLDYGMNTGLKQVLRLWSTISSYRN